MLEMILASEFYSIICLIIPWIVSIAGAIGTACVAIYKVGQVINEFRNSNELKEYNKKMGEYLKSHQHLEDEIHDLKDTITHTYRFKGGTDNDESI